MARSQTDKLSGCNKDKTGLEARCPELGGGGRQDPAGLPSGQGTECVPVDSQC